MNDYKFVLIFKIELINSFIRDVVKKSKPNLKKKPKSTGKIIRTTANDGLIFHCYTTQLRY